MAPPDARPRGREPFGWGQVAAVLAARHEETPAALTGALYGAALDDARGELRDGVVMVVVCPRGDGPSGGVAWVDPPARERRPET